MTKPVLSVPKIRHREFSGKLPETDGIEPLLRRIYLARGINSEEDLDHDLKNLSPCKELPNVDKACALLVDAFKEQKKVLVVGDFDADGATSTALLVKGLRKFGFQQCDFLVPNRLKKGYGLSKEVVSFLLYSARPDLVITADCGATSVEGVEALKEVGVPVIITDHNECTGTVPDAGAVVNPVLDEKTKKLGLAGVGVVFYLLVALRKKFTEEGFFTDSPPRLDCYLDLVALGTVADVVPLNRNNRILVTQGLKRIRAGRGCAGIQALFVVSRARARHAVATDLSYCIAPRLNAASFLKDTSLGIRCLISDDRRMASQYAAVLEGVGSSTRELERRIKSGVNLEDICNLSPEHEDSSALCIYNPEWPDDFLNSIAFRLKSQYRKPTAAFTKYMGGVLRGVACSVRGVHVKRLLQSIANRESDLLTHFGGHAMSASIMLKEDRFEEFKNCFNEEVTALENAGEFFDTLLSDGQLAADSLTFETALSLREGGPWGKGFPEPVFDGIFDVWERWMVGKKHLKMVLSPDGVDEPVYAILFNARGRNCTQDMGKVRITYRLEADEFKGRRAPLLDIHHIEVLA